MRTKTNDWKEVSSLKNIKNPMTKTMNTIISLKAAPHGQTARKKFSGILAPTLSAGKSEENQ